MAHVTEGLRLIAEGSLDEYGPAGLLQAVAARVFIQHGDTASALEAVAGADRLRPVLNAIPTLAVQMRLELASAQLALANPGIARQLHDEARQILAKSGDLGLLSRQADRLRETDGRERVQSA